LEPYTHTALIHRRPRRLGRRERTLLAITAGAPPAIGWARE
jgi:hypothetical protein